MNGKGNRLRPGRPRPPTIEELAALIAELRLDVDALKSAGVFLLLKQVNESTTRLEAQGERIIMAISQSERAIIDSFNGETNRLAQLLIDLRDNGPQDDTEYNAELTGIIDRLKLVGSNPTEPIPPVVE